MKSPFSLELSVDQVIPRPPSSGRGRLLSLASVLLSISFVALVSFFGVGVLGIGLGTILLTGGFAFRLIARRLIEN